MESVPLRVIPMCWKCASADFIGSGVGYLVGCSEDDSITSYEEAEEKCPLIHKDDCNGVG